VKSSNFVVSSVDVSHDGFDALGNGGNECVDDENVVRKIPGLIASKEKLVGVSVSVLSRCSEASLVEVADVFS